MCGILGIWAKNKQGQSQLVKTEDAIRQLSHRGPDHTASFYDERAGIGHCRLSVLDTSNRANQPFSNDEGRYVLSYNGEIYNFATLRDRLVRLGYEFKTSSDTEVLYYHLIEYGSEGLKDLNGCFAFLLYDKRNEEILFARDRLGIKPLIIYEDEQQIILSSELNVLYHFDIDKTIDQESLNLYFNLTYVPAPKTILQNAFKVCPGQYGKISSEGLVIKNYYRVERKPHFQGSFQDATKQLKYEMHQAVKSRLVADVPVGTFLSGGVDSSVVSAIAKEHKADLNTFSIGFDHPYFDESKYSRQVAAHIRSNHHEYVIRKKEFQQEFEQFLSQIDEPFADSSAFAVHFLAKETKKHLTVALSGDGADELFGGYRKHIAEWNIRNMSWSKSQMIQLSSALLKKYKVSRSDKSGDFNRKLQKLSEGMKKDPETRYWEWCTFSTESEICDLLKPEWFQKTKWNLGEMEEMNDVLIADQRFVLPNDMLKKVDLMSMANALEVRTPFLDHHVVDFANSLHRAFKLNKKQGKIILKETFKKDLPDDILYRNKKGFEVPLEEWLSAEINGVLSSNIFSEPYLESQNIFQVDTLKSLINDSANGKLGERIYLLWSIIIFQHWYNRFYG